MNIEIPLCLACKHLIDIKTQKCEAYDVIPDAIWDIEVQHNKPYPGDHGIQFEARQD
jgi:hypothetical protein